MRVTYAVMNNCKVPRAMFSIPLPYKKVDLNYCGPGFILGVIISESTFIFRNPVPYSEISRWDFERNNSYRYKEMKTWKTLSSSI